MRKLELSEQENNVLQWGGISGILGGILFLFVMAFVSVTIPDEPSILEEWVTRFPDLQVARTIENLAYLSGLVFVIPLFSALYQALKKTDLAPSLFGSILSIVGLSSMIISATPHTAHSRISNLYQTLEPGAENLSAMAISWQATWGMTDSMLYIGFFLVPIGFILLGRAMIKTAAFGRSLSLVSIILGIISLAAAIMQIIDPLSDFGAISFISIIFYSFIYGIKLFRLSRAK